MMGVEELEEPDHSSSNWYFPREHIEKSSPSRMDRIDLKKETYLRKSYCTFLQDLGMRLKVPQVTIATSIVFCHRFFLRQSHAKNDRYLIATSCMFLAGKVEETPQKLCDVIFLSYEIRNKKDSTAAQRIRHKDLYEPQKELVLLGERLVLTTLGFDLNIHHPYKPLVAAIKKFKVAQNALAQVAWNFVNDGLRTSLCLQFKPHHIAAGAIFLAAKFLKVKLPSEGEKVWWQEFEVTPRQLEEVSNQMLELYEQNRESPASRASDPSANVVGSTHNRASVEAPASSSMQISERSSAAESKARGNANSTKRSADDALPTSIETPENATGEQKARIGASNKAEAQMIPSVSETSLIEEAKSRIDANCSNQAANLDSFPPTHSLEKNPTRETDPGKSSSVITLLTVNQKVEEIPVWKSKEIMEDSSSVNGTLIACTQISEAKVLVVEEVEQNFSLSHHQAQLKSEFVDIADVNIDRVKAAMQRRKKGDKRPSLAKREITDEELLEMELENGERDQHQERTDTDKRGSYHMDGEMSARNSDKEAEELLEKSFENTGVGKRRSRDSYEQRWDGDIDGRRRAAGDERHERDHKMPRLDHGN